MSHQLYSTVEPDRGAFIEPHTSNVLTAYFGDVVDWHGYVKFLSLAALRETSRDVLLEKLFVEPNLSTQYVSPDMMEQSSPPVSVNLTKALSEHSKLVLLGDPGSGKSTVVNWICTDLRPSSKSSEIRTSLGSLVPLPIVVRELQLDQRFVALKDSKSRWRKLLESFLDRPVAAQLKLDREKQSNFEDSILGKLFESGQAFLLIDGIDELPNADVRQALRDAVFHGMSTYPRCRWLMTSRIVGYEEVPFEHRWWSPKNIKDLLVGYEAIKVDSWKDFILEHNPIEVDPAEWIQLFDIKKYTLQFSPDVDRLYLAPFNNFQLEQFTRLWWAQHESNPHLAGTRPKQFLEALKQSHGASSLARLPHLLTMIALIYRVQAELPDGRALLYKLIADAYLGTLDKERGLDYLRPIPYNIEEMGRWLAAVGWHLQRRRGQDSSNSDILIGRNELIDVLTKIIRPNVIEESRKTAELFLDYAGRRSGLLLPRGQDSKGNDQYAFLHLSFQEYFAAQFLRDRVSDPDWVELESENKEMGTSVEDLRSYAKQSVWRETLIFLWESAAFVSSVLPLRLLTRLLDWPRNANQWSDLPLPSVDELNQMLKATDLGSQNLASLTATLSVNPHLGFDEEIRQALWERCWRWQIEAEKRMRSARFFLFNENAVARQLLSRVPQMTGPLKILPAICEELECERLNLGNCVGIDDLSFISTLKTLTKLDLTGCANIRDLTALKLLSKIRFLYLRDCIGILNLSPLENLATLKSLNLAGCLGVTDFSPLICLNNLDYLNIGGCRPEATKILSQLNKLDVLVLNNCDGMRDFSGLSKCRRLQRLNLDKCVTFEDLNLLSNLHRLRFLSIRDCPNIRDLSPLEHLHNLNRLNFIPLDPQQGEELARFAKIRPDVGIFPKRAGKKLVQ